MRILLMLALVALLPGGALPAWAGPARVEARNDLITATFDATPVPEALDAIREATRVEIVVPAATREKTLTLTAVELRFEAFVRRVLHALDLGGFALVYEPNGAASRVIVVDRARGGPSPGTTGPVYVPPATPPVYVPPREPPVYIPPREPPVYVPPTTPPVYVPPATPPLVTTP